MQRVKSPDSITVSYDKYGSGPPLVLIHGALSDHKTNWEFVKPLLDQRFTVYAIARRGRGETTASEGHGLPDEARDAAAVIQAVGEPVFLLGHSYGGQTALAAAAIAPDRIRKLVLYEPPWPHAMPKDALARLEGLAAAGDWEGFVSMFIKDVLQVPLDELEELRASELWPPMVSDARATLGDFRALSNYDFKAERFGDLSIPVLLQIGPESPRDLYITDALAAVLPDARIEELPGQAHEAMTTAPELYAESVTRFLSN
jgi:pimeloyl-ACP methyl ester carboxylesterase